MGRSRWMTAGATSVAEAAADLSRILGRDPRWFGALLVSATVIAVYFAITVVGTGDLRLRRHRPDLLPGLADRVHRDPLRVGPQAPRPAAAPGRRGPDRVRRRDRCPAPGDLRRGRQPGHLDQPVRPVDPPDRAEPGPVPRAVAGAAQRPGPVGRPGRPGPLGCSTTCRPARSTWSGRSSRSPWPASA